MTDTGFTALVVEDEPLIALDTEDMLRAMGATDVHIVDEIGAAAERLGGCHYGVVLFDLDLGGMSTAKLVSDYLNLGCKALVVSGADGRDPDLADVDVQVLSKPVDPSALRSALLSCGVGPLN